jgi:hypothetical protein
VSSRRPHTDSRGHQLDVVEEPLPPPCARLSGWPPPRAALNRSTTLVRMAELGGRFGWRPCRPRRVILDAEAHRRQGDRACWAKRPRAARRLARVPRIASCRCTRTGASGPRAPCGSSAAGDLWEANVGNRASNVSLAAHSSIGLVKAWRGSTALHVAIGGERSARDHKPGPSTTTHSSSWARRG